MENKNKPLVSVVVLSYNNIGYLQDCISSVLNQNYSNIELIVSDDGSKQFDSALVSRFIDENKKKNLVKYVVHQNEKNIGTSKNFNNALLMTEGDYVKFIAADDLFYSEDALSKLVKAALTESSNVVIARSPNYDMYLERQEWIYPSDFHWNLMKEAAADSKMFFSIMAPYCLISAPSVLYDKSFLLEMGAADENYKIIEDWPFWLKMIRLRKSFTFLNEPITVYRSGGVSNGKSNEIYAYHQIEFANVIANECLKYPENFFSKDMYKDAVRSERMHRRDGEKELAKTFSAKALIYLRYFDTYIYNLLEKIKNKSSAVFDNKRNIAVYAIATLTIYSIIDIESLLKIYFSERIVVFIQQLISCLLIGLGYASLALCVAIYIVCILMKIRKVARK